MSPVALPSKYAVALHAPKDLRIEQRTSWPPHQDYAQVSIVSTGLCGSDLHYYLHGKNGDFAIRAPLVLGHEAAGIVTAVGAGVKHLVPGQRVAIEAGIMCNRCDHCLKGRYNLCPDLRFCSSAKTFPHLDGTLQQTITHPAHLLHPLPDNISYELAALAEPLSVLIHAARRANLEPGQTVLVFGVGTIGLLACALAKAYGAARVVAIDINADRLSFAKATGFASQTFCLPKVDNAKTTEEQLRRAEGLVKSALKEFNVREGFDLVFECSGAASCIQMSCHAAISGGKVMLIGMGSPKLILPLAAAAVREVDILGSFRYARTYPAALALLSSGKLRHVEKLITHRFSLEDTAHAFDVLARGEDDDGQMVIKIMIACS